MKSYVTYILVSLLLLSVVFNIYQAIGKPEDPSLENPPVSTTQPQTTQPPETTVPPTTAAPELTRAEKYMIYGVISEALARYRGEELPRNFFLTQDSYEMVRDLCNSYSGGNPETYYIYLKGCTDEMVATFRMIFPGLDWITVGGSPFG
jgi:hypothetical protein